MTHVFFIKSSYNHCMWRYSVILILSILLVACHQKPAHPSHAVIIMYHRFGESQYPSTNVTLKQFQQQIHLLTTGGYHVMPIPVIVNYLQKGKKLPDKTVGITIDDAYESAYTIAWPLLQAAHLPFTLMVATDPIDQHYQHMMTWQQIKYLSQHGVTIGLHSSSHLHFVAATNAVILADLQHSQKRLKQEIGHTAKLFAYPYGEYQAGQENLLKSMGIVAAFKQTSGVITAQDNFYTLPRFPINENYGDQERFRLITQALPFPIKNLKPMDPVIYTNPPLISFETKIPDALMKSMSCYQSDVGKIPMILDHKKVLLTPMQPFTLRRTHINCTVADQSARWHWLGLMFILPDQPEG